MQTVNIGGDRLGSGNKMDVTLHSYERSTHDLSYMWKSTMAPGTLVPFMKILGLPGDTFDINLNSLVKTHPTIGPLFGSFKLQLDVFTCPIRLYHRALHNNKLGIGLDMSSIRFPVLELTAEPLDNDSDIPIEFQQVNQSSLFAYLGIRGLGAADQVEDYLTRAFNAIPYLAYFDIFKNYYANKMETYAYIIHTSGISISVATLGGQALPQNINATGTSKINVKGTNITISNVQLSIGTLGWFPIGNVCTPEEFPNIVKIEGQEIEINTQRSVFYGLTVNAVRIDPNVNLSDVAPVLTPFEISTLDQMREELLTTNETPYIIDSSTFGPYGLPLNQVDTTNKMCCIFGQEGLLVKTYQSDLFNNWIKTEMIEGSGSISEVTAISTSGDSFTLDTLNLSKKVYDMLNRIAVSGGSYDDYIKAVWDFNSKWRAETPVYVGGLSKEVIFQEVISQAATTEEPLGTLAGKGVMADKHKGGHIVINVDEPCYIIGIVSLTPRVDYSQGNDWDMNLFTMDDLHKPALDGIGFQDLITDQMHFADTLTNPNTGEVFKSAGKQPAWLNYMTNYNKSYGNFADPRTQMFMTLNRKYNGNADGINDLTTYIDPSKFNYAFAQVDLSAQNFWVQIANDITGRRKISAKLIPYL